MIEYLRGVYIFTDHVFDDRGASDFSYPSAEAPYKNNAADLVELQMRPDVVAGAITFGVRLNTLLFEHVPVVAIGIDDGSGAGVVDWPFDDGVRAAGVRWVLTLQAGGGTLTDLVGETSLPITVVVKNDTGPGERDLENTLTVTLEAASQPRRDLARPARHVFVRRRHVGVLAALREVRADGVEIPPVEVCPETLDQLPVRGRVAHVAVPRFPPALYHRRVAGGEERCR
ncbi:MAG: hypothetical protein ACREQY_13420 [Candidatus Binatia bacterium]